MEWKKIPRHHHEKGVPIGFRKNKYGGTYPIYTPYDIREGLDEYYSNFNEKGYETKYCDNCLNKWKRSKNKDGKAINIKVEDGKVNILGKTYVIDGFKNKFNYTKEEKNIMDMIAKNYDVKVQMLPQINNPRGEKMADSLLIWRNGIKERWDLKRIEGNGKQTLFSAVKDKNGQAQKFLYYISKKSSLSDYQIKVQIDDIFRHNRTDFVKEVAVMRGNFITIALKKKK